MKPRTLVVLDIDGTLCASLAVPERRGDLDFRAWERRIAAAGADLPLVHGAAAGVARVVEAGLPVALVTARRRTLEAATRTWLAAHLPALAAAPLRMRVCELPSKALRAAQLRTLHLEHEEPELLVLDDGPIEVELPGLRAFRAPAEWEAFALAVAAAAW